MKWMGVANQEERARTLLARFGAEALTPELVRDGELRGHITVAARIWNQGHTHVLRVWSAKNQKWQLPGSHGEGDFDLERIARREALRALGLSSDGALNGGEAVEIETEEVAEYWNTPAHLHFTVVFEFKMEGREELPHVAKWFDAL